MVQQQAPASSSDSDGDDCGACGPVGQLPACTAAGVGGRPSGSNGVRLHVTADPGDSGWRRLLMVLGEMPHASREQQATEAMQQLAAVAGAAPVTLTCWYVATASERAAGAAHNGSGWQDVLARELGAWSGACSAALQLVPVGSVACWAPVMDDGSVASTASWAVLQALVLQV